MASYFTKLVNKDRQTLDWTRNFIGADHVQKTIIAAEQKYALINLSFTIDLPFLTGKFLKAGAGISAWAGTLVVNRRGKVRKKYPLFYSIKQMMRHIRGYDKITRVRHRDDRVRLYKISKGNKFFWIGWYNAKRVVLPKTDSSIEVKLDIPGGVYEIEKLATSPRGVKRVRARSNRGRLNLTLQHRPVYIFPRNRPRSL